MTSVPLYFIIVIRKYTKCYMYMYIDQKLYSLRRVF